jgi:peptidoglycan/LPS O-acetylase OafA/YrhL
LGALLIYLKNYHSFFLNKVLKKSYIFFSALIFSILFIYIYTLTADLNLLIFAFNRFLFSLFCFWVIGVATTVGFKGLTKLFLENRYIKYLGKISYGLYVYHHFMPYFFGRFGYNVGGHSILLNSFFYLIATIIISSISWHFFEYPINKLKERFSYN